MARTKASVGAKVSSGKSNKARCSAAPPSSSSGSSSSVDRGGRSSGGNAVCPRETPKWQRAITTFFVMNNKPSADTNGEAAGSCKPRHKRNIIESDDEDTPKNSDLDDSIRLEPLTGEDSHKIEEYYPKNGEKGKGVGKKSKGKENINVKNNKRDREESSDESVSKKVKI